MSQATAAGFADVLGARIQAEHRMLAARWLERLKSLLRVEKNEIFPTSSLLDHIPALLQEIGAYLRAPEEEEIAAKPAVIEKARDLGHLRHLQQASVHQILREYDILGRILETFLAEEAERLKLDIQPADCIAIASRLSRAVRILMQATIDTFVGQYTETLNKHAGQLESFTRVVSHELRNPLGTLQYALALLADQNFHNDPLARARVLALAQRNADRAADLIHKIQRLAQAEAEAPEDTPTRQLVDVTALAREVSRQLRDMADARGVEIRIAPALPSLLIDVARFELILMNLVSNAIKYCDPAKPARYVEVVPGDAAAANACVIIVRDNGLGIPHENADAIFDKFFRAHSQRDQELNNEGVGLGLSIVLECVEALNGRIEVQSVEGEGTSFVLAFPDECRPALEAASA